MSRIMYAVGYNAERKVSRTMMSTRALGRAFLGVSAVLFVASVTATSVGYASMLAMGGMPVPGGWSMSIAWILTGGQTWPSATASFLGMWVVVMVAMKLPSLVPMLWRSREAFLRSGAMFPGRQTALVGVGYFLVWSVFETTVFPVGGALATIEMRHPMLARAVQFAVAAVVLLIGAAIHRLEGTSACLLTVCTDA